MTAARWLAVVAVLAAAPVTAQPSLDRPPTLGGTWVPERGVVRFDFLHRFYVTPSPNSGVVNFPTFTLATGVASRLGLGMRYSTRSETQGENDEAEVYGRWQALARGPVRVSLTPAYNTAARSVDGEVAVDWTRGRVTLSGAVRGMSRPYGDADAGLRSAIAAGAVLRLNDYVAVGGDVASLLDAASTESPAWSAGLLLVIPGSPHTFSLHVSNVDANTIQGSSREGRHRLSTAKPLYGFEFTVPIHLARFAPWFGSGRRAAAADAPGPEVAVAAQVEMRDYRYQRDTVYVAAGQAVRWTNADPVEHTVTFAPGGPPSSGNLGARDAFVARFDRPGTYAYHCVPHPFMKGVVVVR
jgi:plastocyanin